jgi:hypothetical protein
VYISRVVGEPRTILPYQRYVLILNICVVDARPSLLRV